MTWLLIKGTQWRAAAALYAAGALVHLLLGPNPLPLPTAPESSRMNIVAAMLVASGLVVGTELETPLQAWRPTRRTASINAQVLGPQLLVAGVLLLVAHLLGAAPAALPWAAVGGVALAAAAAWGAVAGLVATALLTVVAVSTVAPDALTHPLLSRVWVSEWYSVSPDPLAVASGCAAVCLGVGAHVFARR